MESWIRDLKEDPDDVLLPVLKGLRYATSEQLVASYQAGDEQARLTQGIKNNLGKALANSGFERIELKMDGDKRRLWRLGNTPASEDMDGIRAHVRQFAPKFVG